MACSYRNRIIRAPGSAGLISGPVNSTKLPERSSAVCGFVLVAKASKSAGRTSPRHWFFVFGQVDAACLPPRHDSELSGQ
jgi:hypothetical protein